MKVVAATLLLAAGALLAGALHFAVLRPRAIRENEKAAVETLKRLRSAQERFRLQDLDGNQISDYWTSDLAGLGLADVTDGHPLKGYRFLRSWITIAPR